MAEIVKTLLDKIDPALAKEILFINQGKSNGRDIPMAEVKFTSIDWAKKARQSFVSKLKGGMDLGKVHMANSVCLATRVRVDILKAIAKQFSNPEGDQMYVAAYSSRPVLHIKSGEGQRPFALTFSDAIARFGMDVTQDGLGEAYKRAGRAFTGQLEQHFVVLREKSESLPGSSVGTGPTNTNSRKRRLEDQSVSFERNNSGRGSRGRGMARGRSHWQAKASRR